MAIFPTTEPAVLALADFMVTGLTAHPGDFPSVTPAQLTALQAQLSSYREAKSDQDVSKGNLQVMTAVKDENLDTLVEMMKDDLTKAEMDCKTAPQHLAEIGWGPRSTPTPIVAPGVPIKLVSSAEGTGEIWLAWEKPTDGGGAVRNYLVERCEKLPDGNFGPWILVQTTYNTEAHVIEQPSNARLIFRVKAANAAGVSMPSNTILVVLP